MRIEVKATLVSGDSENDEIQMTFDVLASATVRVIGQTHDCPGECLIEDIEIDSVELCHISYGEDGGEFLWGDSNPAIKARGDAARLKWLNRQLDENDRWADKIREAVLREHAKASELQHA